MLTDWGHSHQSAHKYFVFFSFLFLFFSEHSFLHFLWRKVEMRLSSGDTGTTEVILSKRIREENEVFIDESSVALSENDLWRYYSIKGRGIKPIIPLLDLFSNPSFLRRQDAKEIGITLYVWIPACAGMTKI